MILHLIIRLKLKENLCLFQQERKLEPELPIGDFRQVQISHKDQTGLALQASHAWRIKQLKLPLQREMSNIMLSDNSGLVPQCGRLGPNMTTILMGGQCGESGGAGEFHPHAPTDPCVNLSIHTAPLIQLMAFTPATLLYAQGPPISG